MLSRRTCVAGLGLGDEGQNETRTDMTHNLRVVLISTYELGHQPFGLASPAAWLREAGARVTCLDLAVERLDEPAIAAADLVAFYVPMHTATRLAASFVERVKRINPNAHLCFYGLYAPVNEEYLRGLGAGTILGGEFEEGLVALVERLSADESEPSRPPAQPEPTISLNRQQFLVPDRSRLPGLERYAHVKLPGGGSRVAGYTEASRGCKHLCRHCPIVPVYGGRFFVVQPDVVLEDIARQVAAGAEHITFGDPDFFNGPTHAMRIVQELHRRFPRLTYDVIIKVEHLLKHAGHLPTLRDTGCLFVTSAVEAVDDRILEIFDKRHTREDFVRAVLLCREVGLNLNPTFVTFNPWITLPAIEICSRPSSSSAWSAMSPRSSTRSACSSHAAHGCWSCPWCRSSSAISTQRPWPTHGRIPTPAWTACTRMSSPSSAATRPLLRIASPSSPESGS